MERRNRPVFRLALWSLAAVAILTIVVQIDDWRNEVITRAEQLHADSLSLEVRRIRLSRELQSFGENPVAPYLWEENERGVVNARIQAHISQLATQSGLSLRSISPVGTGVLVDRQTAVFRLEAEARLDHLSDFLRDLEYKLPTVLVEGAILRRLTRPGSTSDQPELFAQLDLIAPIHLLSDEEGE